MLFRSRLSPGFELSFIHRLTVCIVLSFAIRKKNQTQEVQNEHYRKKPLISLRLTHTKKGLQYYVWSGAQCSVTVTVVQHFSAQITSYVSWCGGLPAPENSDSPLRYKFRSVLNWAGGACGGGMACVLCPWPLAQKDACWWLSRPRLFSLVQKKCFSLHR